MNLEYWGLLAKVWLIFEQVGFVEVCTSMICRDFRWNSLFWRIKNHYSRCSTTLCGLEGCSYFYCFFFYLHYFKIKLQRCGKVLCFITAFEIKLKMFNVSTMVVSNTSQTYTSIQLIPEFSNDQTSEL